MIRRLKKDVLSQLPAKRRMRVPLDPERMNQDILREVERRVKTMTASAEDLDGSSCDVNISQLFRLTADAKIAASLEYVEHLIRLGIKFLLFAHHHSTLDALERKIIELKTDLIRIDGKTRPGQRPERVARFQQEDSVRVALLSITAAGTGLTLTAAQTVVFAEMYWVPGQMQQAEDRAHRIGQRDCVTVQYLVAKGTIDDVVYNSLEKKSKNTSAILDGQQCGFDAFSVENSASAAEEAAPQTKREGHLLNELETSLSKRARLE
jgi:SWI/SNF-related matrix-associated actin-dependent regulator 1 of chromatin subfamily A